MRRREGEGGMELMRTKIFAHGQSIVGHSP